MSGGHHGPRSVEEMQEAEEIHAAEKLHEGIKGFYLTDPFNVPIEAERLGVRHDIAKQLEKERPGKRTQEILIDARVTEQLRQKIKREKEEKKTAWRLVPGSEEWMKNRKKDFKNFTRVFKNPLRWFRDDYDEHAAEIEEEYGDASDLGKMKLHLNGKLHPLMTSAALPQTAIDRLNSMIGIAPNATAPNPLDPELLIKVTPLQLLEIQQTLVDSSGVKIFRDDDATFQRLFELRQIEATEKTKVISVHIYDPSVLRKEVSHSLEHSADPTDQAILDKMKKLMGNHFDHGLEHDYKLRALFAELRFKRDGNAAELDSDLDEVLKAYPVDKRTVVERELSETEKQNNTKLDEHTGKLHEVAARLVGKIEEKDRVDAALSTLKTEKNTLKRIKAQKSSEESSFRTQANASRSNRKSILQDIDTINIDIGNAERDLSKKKSGLTQKKKELREEKKQSPQNQATITTLENDITSIESDIQTLEGTISHLRNILKTKQRLKTDADHEIEKFERELREVAQRDEFSDLKNKERELETRERDLNKQQADLVKDIHHEEQEYKNAANVFTRFIEETMKRKIQGTAANNDEKIGLVKAAVNPPHIDQTFIKNFVHDLDFKNRLESEISKMKAVGTKVEYLSPDYVLFELKKREVQRLGKFHDEGQILKVARMATSFAQIDAKNVELFRAGNREIAQGKVKGWKGLAGVWRKSKQQIASGFFNSDTFKGRDIIEHIAGLDHAFECFKDLPVDASLADIRNAIKHHGGISNENLMKFYMHLQEALKSFTVGHHRKVEIMDRDWPIEQVALFAEKIHAELEAREFVHKFENPDTPEDKQLKLSNKAAYFQKLLNQREESQKKLEAAHLEQMRRPDSDWQVSWIKSLMKGKYGEAYQQALAKGKEQGLSGKALRDFVSSEGSIPKTVLKHLMTGLALKEAYDITSKSTKWIGSKLFNASKKAASVGVEKGGGLLSAAWRNLGKPAAGATGRGLKAVGRGALRVGKFALWDVWKFSFWTAPKWTAQKAWNVTTWPFRMVGRGAKGFWNFFHYTEEKRARDAAWYAAKKAAAGHGGGGHGGGGHGGGH